MTGVAVIVAVLAPRAIRIALEELSGGAAELFPYREPLRCQGRTGVLRLPIAPHQE